MLRRVAAYLFVIFWIAAPMPGQSAAKFRISGKVVNAVNGHPLPGAEVQIGKADDFDATQQKMLANDDGTFAFTVESTGKYLLVGEARGFRRQGYEQHGIYVSAVVVGEGKNSENIVFRLRADGRILGTVVDEEHEPLPGATVYLFRTDASGGLRQTYLAIQGVTDDRGIYRLAHLEPGCYYLVVSAGVWFNSFLQTTADAGGESRALETVYPTTFYPGVTEQASASQIALNEGEDFTADFTLVAQPGLRVRLDHLNADPQKQRGVTLEKKLFGTVLNQVWQRQVPLGDSLEIRNVTPGRYVLDIQSNDLSQARSRMLDVTADSEVDPDRASPIASIGGSVTVEGDPTAQAQAVVRLWNSRTNELLEAGVGEKGKILFTSEMITPGRYSVFAMNGENSTIASVRAVGAPVEGQSIEVRGGKPIQLEIVLSHSMGKIDGIAQRDGKPVPGAMVLLVPESPEINLPKFRRDESDGDGTFTLRDVLPGRYRVMAVEDGWDWEWGNPQLLKKRLEHAQEIEVQPNRIYQRVVVVE
jgi:hypothetical protein